MTAGRINQVYMQPVPKPHKGPALLLLLLLLLLNGHVKCGYTNNGWGCCRIANTCGLHHHITITGTIWKISTSEQATSRKHNDPFAHPNLPLTAGMVATTQNLEQIYTTPHPQQQQHHLVEEPCQTYPTCHLPAMCHPNTPTKTDSCNGWEQMAPDANQSPVNVVAQINAASKQMPHSSNTISFTMPCHVGATCHREWWTDLKWSEQDPVPCHKHKPCL